MPLSPHTPPGTHIVVTWATTSLEEYAYQVILPSYRQIFFNVCRGSRYCCPYFKVGERYVLSGIEPAVGTKSGFLCTVENDPNNYGHALEHFDVVQLPKSITDLLVSKPVDEVV